MVDPGTAVGVISLGLQVLQGLSNYYSQFASFSVEITTVVERIQSLCAIIDALDGAVQKLQRDEPISAAVRQCIDACKAGLRDLEVYQKKCGEITLVPTTIEDKIQLVKKRLLFPFRKGTLEDLQKILDRLQSNLDTIILALQLDTAILHDDRAKNKPDVLSRSLDLVHRRQIYGIELLETVSTTSSLQVEQIKNGSARVETSLEKMSSQLQNFQNVQDNVAQQLQSLASAMTHFQGQVPPPPLLIKDACDSYMSLTKPIGSLFKQQNKLSRRFEKGGAFTCSCPSVPRAVLEEILSWTGLDVNSEEHMIPSFIRLLTFERLGLTHTCHDHGHYKFGCDPKLPLAASEIFDIQFVENSDIDLLEDLLEEFEEAMQEHTGSIWDFIDGYWKDRMDQIMSERDKPIQEEEEQARQLGVTIHGYFGPEPQGNSITDEKPEWGSWEWFERKVSKIMDNV
ncbi:hypothetical protein K505DRAFT_366174 [Melanomma pulvis-pyrius CBS 109.77]|uniref:Fungal N-terminal domain-containing protein n=1 Tax=Melanomma pulvis-pyrius CBS 109.77 TaxID=1314802 RepID=A0A6A6WXZ3_9PLEO|nr:hypothetical protein K505DRAFT_366174 [Melanomma pulvis-pyrius CBS 109.77]